MKRLLLVLLLVPSLSFAQARVLAPTLPHFAAPQKPVSFEFSGVSVVAFGQAVFKNILHRDFVIDPDVVALDRKITINVASVKHADVPAFVESILERQGISTALRDGVYYLSAKREPANGFDLSAVRAPAAVASASAQAVAPAAVAPQLPDASEFYPLRHRAAAFVVPVLAAVFGPSAAVAAGSGVVLSADKKGLARMRRLLDDLDTPPLTVEVSASFVEVSRSSSSARGVSLIASVLGMKLGAAVGSTNGGFSIRSGSFQLVLDALDADSRFRQVSSSRVVGDDLERMALSVGDETPTVGSTSTDKAGNAIQSINYRASGVILDVLPRVSGSGVLSLLVDGQVSSFQTTATGVSTSPTLIKRQVKTSVSLSDGEVLIIGGLDDTKTSGGTSGPWFLPSSLHGRNGGDSHTDLVLILSARVIRKAS